MAYTPPNPNGAATAANSSPVAIATDQLSTLAKETGGNLATVATNTGNIPAKGQAASAASTPVVIASDQSAVKIAPILSGTNAQQRDDSYYADGNGGGGVAMVAARLFNGSTYDRPYNGSQLSAKSAAVVIASDQSAVPVANGYKVIPFTTSTAGAQTLLADTDVRGYTWVEVFWVGIGTGLTLNGGQFSSNTGSNYVSYTTWTNSNNGSSSSNSALTPGTSLLSYGPTRGNYFQISVSALTSGTVSGYVTLRTVAPPLTATTVNANQSGTWTMQPGNTANTTPWLIAEQKAGTSTITSVTGSATSVSLLASNTSRKGAYFYNDSTSVLYINVGGTTASATNYTTQIPPQTLYELPSKPLYTGAITGIWASANGAARITELS